MQYSSFADAQFGLLAAKAAVLQDSQNVASRQKDVPDALDVLARVAHSLEERFSMLAQRLQPLCRPQPPSAEEKQGLVDQPKAPLAEALNEVATIIRRVTANIESLDNSLEI